MVTTWSKYRIGIDVGARSLGFCAVGVDDDGQPVKILNSMVLAHDGGLDPEGQKTATTRRASAGVARRARRLVRRRRERLRVLDNLLTELGWPITDPNTFKDPYHPWVLRANLATTKVKDEAERNKQLAIAARHIARHRGWRNPYIKAETLLVPVEDSDKLIALRGRVENAVGRELPAALTPAQLVTALKLTPQVKLRGDEGLLGGKLMQSDNARELMVIAKTQGLDEETTRQLVLATFAARSPKGSAAERVGKDPLPGQSGKYRCLKAESAFQHYRIAAILANLRVRVAGSADRVLTVAERKICFELLADPVNKKEITWLDVAEKLGLEREQLRGTATPTADGDRAGSRPPTYVTANYMMGFTKVKPLPEWWRHAGQEERDALIRYLSNAVAESETATAADEVAIEFLETLEDEHLLALDDLKLPAGRAAYSADSLIKLTALMLEAEHDVHSARREAFKVSDDWRPPADPIGMPVGNPSVDRVTKAVARWLMAAEREWGVPEVVNIEHVREGFMSDLKTRELERDMKKREDANRRIAQEINDHIGAHGKVARSDTSRYLAFTRQHGKCAYCDKGISFTSLEMDHIVPQAGVGSTNRRDNLVAVCEACNKSKSKMVFSVWAETQGISVTEVASRVKMWTQDPGTSGKDWKQFQQNVITRLKRTTEDPEFDGRSMESIAWMANELRHRIEQHWAEEKVQVGVYRGQLTAEARKASGFEGKISFIGGSGKTRLDRRHHAMDAACMAMMRPKVAQVLAQRVNQRDAQRVTRDVETWKSFSGTNPAARTIWQQWLGNMNVLAELFNQAVAHDRIPVMENLRLRLGNGSVHKDTVNKLVQKRLGDEWSMEAIDRASTPALWCALTRAAGFEFGKGLPADESRVISVNGTKFTADDRVKIFPSKAAAILVREGAVEVGNAVHHARIYRISGKKDSYGMVRVFVPDLLKYRHEDLFEAPLLPQSLSMRDADMKLRIAIQEGNAEYLGWIAVGDELLLDMPSESKTQVGQFLEQFPGTVRWRVHGFYSNTRLRIRPTQIAAEGFSKDVIDAVAKTVDAPGWLPAVNVLWGQCNPVVVRRDALGKPRIDSHGTGLPESWQV
ncbi:MAG: type II CRISPR RNA-guided endonuclease Cas9 [Propionibacteriaceae bacterium]